MCHLQELHQKYKYKDKELVILGFNSSDDKKVALEFLQDNSVTFPNILDSSDAADKIASESYKCSSMPLNYIIDKEGKIVDAWLGYEKGHKRAKASIEKLGLKFEDP